MELSSPSKIFLPSKELSKIYSLINSLRNNPKEYLTTHIIPNASTFSSSSLKFLVSFLKNKLSLPSLKHNPTLQHMSTSYLQYFILTDKNPKTNPRYSLENRIRSLGLQPYQYNEIILKYISPHSTIISLLLNEHFRDYLFNPNMQIFSMVIDTLPNGDHCIMINIAGEGSSLLLRNTNTLSLCCFSPIRNVNKALSVNCSFVRSNKTFNGVNMSEKDDKKRRNIEKVLNGDDEVYVCEKGRMNDKGIKKRFINLNKMFPKRIGVDINKMEKVDCVNGYNMYVITKKFKKERERNRWLMDFNKDLSGENWGKDKKGGHRHTFTSFY